jgi:hypothetical protein
MAHYDMKHTAWWSGKVHWYRGGWELRTDVQIMYVYTGCTVGLGCDILLFSDSNKNPLRDFFYRDLKSLYCVVRL